MTRQSSRGWLVPLVVCAVIGLVVSSRLPLYGAAFSLEGEAREAELAADVVRHGNWIAPYPNGDFVPTKGPCLYWWSGVFAKALGLREWVLRASVSAAMLGVLACSVAIGYGLGSPALGWLAAGALATSFPFWTFLLKLRVDTLLTLWVAATLLCFFWSLRDPRWRLAGALLGQVALAAACLTKGLPALVPVLSTVAGVALLRRDPRLAGIWILGALLTLGLVAHAGLLALAAGVAVALVARRGPESGARWLELAPGLVFAAILVTWVHLADARYPVPYLDFAIQDSLSRVSESAGHRHSSFLKPVYWYLPRFLADFLPWTLFLPAGIAAAVAGLRRDRTDRVAVALLWFGLTFALFSLFAYKRKAYLLPLYPAAALLVGLGLAGASESALCDRLRRGAHAVLAAMGAVAALVGGADALAHAVAGRGLLAALGAGPLPEVVAQHWLGVDLALMAAGACWIAARRRPPPVGALAVLAGQCMVVVVVGVLAVERETGREETPAAFATRIQEQVPPDAALRFVGNLRDHALLYYLDRRIPVTAPEELVSVVRRAGKPVYVLAPDPRFPPELRAEPLLRGESTSGTIHLVRLSARAAHVPRSEPRP